jgi:hypothetical protein
MDPLKCLKRDSCSQPILRLDKRLIKMETNGVDKNTDQNSCGQGSQNPDIFQICFFEPVLNIVEQFGASFPPKCGYFKLMLGNFAQKFKAISGFSSRFLPRCFVLMAFFFTL